MTHELEDRIRQAVTLASEGLAGDRELRLEVEQELRLHLEEAIQHAEARGESPDAALETALKEFGAPDELAAQLAEANTSRMRIRGRASWMLRKVLLPVSVVVALWLVAAQLARIGRYYDTKIIFSMSGAQTPELSAFEKTAHNLDVAMHGDWEARISQGQSGQWRDLVLPGKTPEETLRRREALLKSNPDNPEYIGAHVHAALGFNEKESLPVLQEAAAADPENAYYPLLAASLMLKQSSKLERLSEGKSQQVVIEESNRELFERGIAEFEAAMKRPKIDAHRSAQIRSRYGAWRDVRSPGDFIDRVMLSAGASLADATLLFVGQRTVPSYAALLIREGQRERAEALVESWERMQRGVLANSETLIEVMMVQASSTHGNRVISEAWEDMGESEKAKKFAIRVESLGELRSLTRSNTAEKDGVISRGGVFLGTIFPAIGGNGVPLPDEATLKTNRWLDYVAIDQVTFALMGLLGLLFLAGNWLAAIARKRKGPPLFLVLGARDYGKILLAGFLVPAAAFYIWTRFLPWSGRELGIARSIVPVLVHAGVLILAVIGLTIWKARKSARNRLREIDAVRGEGSVRPAGTVAHAVAVSLAMMVVCAGLFSLVVLRTEERHLWDREEFLRLSPEYGFTSMEYEITKKLRADTLKALQGSPGGA